MQTRESFDVNYYFEIEFLVAKEQLKDALVADHQAVPISLDPGAGRRAVRQFNPENAKGAGRFGFWLLQPSDTAVARNDAPVEYGWLGCKLRSLLSPIVVLKEQHFGIKSMIEPLWVSNITYVSSTCQFNVFVQPVLEPMGLIRAKKLATLVLLFEQDMLLRLCPLTINAPSGRVVPVGTHSRIATVDLKGLDATRPVDPLMAGIMDQYLPRLHDGKMQERLLLIWGQMSLEELATLLRDANGQPTAFSLHLYNDESGKKDSCLAEFRYALWHPYDRLDASDYWITLSACLMKATTMHRAEFKQFIKSTDEIMESFSQGVDGSTRWKMLLELIGLSGTCAASWEKITDEYGPGGRFSAEKIDKFPTLDSTRQTWGS